MRTRSRLMIGSCLILLIVLVSTLASRMFRPETGGGVIGVESRDPSPQDEPVKRFGWRLWGKVTNLRLEPLPGAAVYFRFFDGESFHEPTELVTTDEKGRYIASLPAPQALRFLRPERALPMEIHGEANASGHRPGRDFIMDIPHPDFTELPQRLDFRLNEGAVLQGRVGSEDGEPVQGAEIYMLTPGRDWKRVAESGRGGAYTVPLEGNLPSHVCAHKIDEGFAPVMTAVDGIAPDLVLREFGVLEGIIRHPDGKPMERLEIYAFHEALKDWREQGLDLHEEADRFLRKGNVPPEGGEFTGLPFGRSRTDEEGRFRIAGLAPGRFFLWPPEGDDPLIKAPQEFFESGDRNIRWSIDVRRIRITLRDEEGYRVPSAELYCGSDRSGDWKRVPGGRIFQRVETGPLFLMAKTEEGLFGECEVEIGEDDFALKLEIVLKKRRENGRMRLRILGAEGERLDPMPPFTLLLTSRSDQYQFDLAPISMDREGTFSLPLYPGRYDLDLFPANEGDNLSKTFFLPRRKDGLEVSPEQEADVLLRMELGGRLSLVFETSGETKAAFTLMIFAKREDKGEGTKEPLYHFLPEGDPPPVTFNRLKTGVHYMCTRLFSPGRYKLEVKSREFDSCTSAFDIHPGKISKVRVPLDRRVR